MSCTFVHSFITKYLTIHWVADITSLPTIIIRHYSLGRCQHASHRCQHASHRCQHRCQHASHRCQHASHRCQHRYQHASHRCQHASHRCQHRCQHASFGTTDRVKIVTTDYQNI